MVQTSMMEGAIRNFPRRESIPKPCLNADFSPQITANQA